MLHALEVEGWTEARIEKLKVLYAEGLSFRQIASELGGGLTRNAVISKTHRLGLPRRLPGTTRLYSKPKEHGNKGVPTAAGIRRRVEARKSFKPAPPPAFETEPLPEEEVGVDVTHLVGILELRSDMCRYIHGDPLDKGNWGYCGQKTALGSPYCPEHHRRCYGVRP